MNNIALLVIGTLSFSSQFALAKDNDNIVDETTVLAYNTINEGVAKYNTEKLKNKFDVFFVDNNSEYKEKASDYIEAIQGIIGKGNQSSLSEKDFDLLEQDYLAQFYLKEGFTEHALLDKKNPKEATQEYIKIWDAYVKKLENVRSKNINLSMKEYVFFSNQFSSEIAEKTVDLCLKDKNQSVYCQPEFIRSQQEDNLFYQIKSACSYDDKCYTGKITSFDFQRKLAYQNYKLGYYLYELDKK